jgi:hypothetical protein
MAEVVIRVRFTGGERTHVVYADPTAATTQTVVDRVVAVLSEEAGSFDVSTAIA